MAEQFSDEYDEKALDDQLTEFTDKLLAGEEIAPSELDQGDDLADLREMAALLHERLPRQQPPPNVVARMRSNLTQEWRRRQRTKTAAPPEPSWRRWLLSLLPQRPTNRRQTQRLALALATLLLAPLIALLFLQQYNGDLLKGTVLTGGDPAYPGPLNEAALARATNLRLGLLSKISQPHVGLASNHNSWSASLSADGRFTAFTSLANNLTPEDDNNNASDIFLHDALDNSIIRISVGPNGEGNGDSFHPALSGDGRFIAFATLADNLAPGSDNGVSDILLYHLETGALERVSGANGQPANGTSRRPVISADGRFIAFQSAASNLVAGDNNGAADIFVFDRQTGAIERVSLNASGAEANGESHSPAISGDGRYVLFVSSATNLSSITANPLENVYLRDRQAGTTTLISVGLDGQAANSHSGAPAISQDGRIIAFQSSASNLIENDNNNAADIFVYERETGRITAVSLNNHGHLGNRSSGAPTLSADGRFVAFTSFAGNFSPISQLGYGSVYLRDRQTGITEQISRGYQGEEADGSSVGAVVSSDGRYVLFDSTAGNLLPGFNNNRVDIFRFDRAPQTDLSLSDAAGQPGSYFTLVGADFPPGETVALSVNGRSLGEITVEADGSFTAVLDSSQANSGLYVTTAAVNLLRVHAHFLLAADAPLRANPGGSALLIPPGIGLDNAVYLPILGNQ